MLFSEFGCFPADNSVPKVGNANHSTDDVTLFGKCKICEKTTKVGAPRPPHMSEVHQLLSFCPKVLQGKEEVYPSNDLHSSGPQCGSLQQQFNWFMQRKSYITLHTLPARHAIGACWELQIIGGPGLGYSMFFSFLF